MILGHTQTFLLYLYLRFYIQFVNRNKGNRSLLTVCASGQPSKEQLRTRKPDSTVALCFSASWEAQGMGRGNS